jgi:DedD protein
MAEAQDVETLKRRGRRRLVGAVALVLAAVIILPMVFDPQPRPPAASVSVRIPGEGEAPFTPKPAPQLQPAPQAKPAAPAKPAPPPKPVAAAPKATTKAPAVQYVFQVGVFANPENITGKLKSAKVPYTTEPLRDRLTRVRAGPFSSREAAEKAHAEMRKLGLEPGAVTTRSG